MPNHFTNVLLCGPGYDSEEIEKENLCEKVLPMPKAFKGIVSGYCTAKDGSTLRNWRNTENGPEPVDEQTLIKEYGACNSLDWARQNWGTKWGTYDMSVPEFMSGDGGSIIITFQTAWGPPNDNCRAKIVEYLKERYGFESVTWSYFDPYDNSSGVLEQ